MNQKSIAKQTPAGQLRPPKSIKRFSRKLFLGDLSIRGRQFPKALISGLLAVTFLYVSVAGLTSITTSWYVAKGDTIPHVDYVWRLYNGDIPKYSQGITYPPFVERGGGKQYQQASPNPPLFYAIHAPFDGPFLNKGEWRKGIAIGRAINILIGIACILALAWAGWEFGGKRQALFAVAVPALAGLTHRFTRLMVDFPLDSLLVLFTTLTLINISKIIQKGAKLKYLVWLTLLSVGGMATKATYIVFLMASLSAVIVASALHGRVKTYKSILKGIAISVAITGVVVAAIGWFYYLWNYRANGNWFDSLPANYHGSRTVYKSLGSIVTSYPFWALFVTRYSVIPLVSAAISGTTLLGYLKMGKNNFVKLKQDRARLWIVGLMVLVTLGVVATQLKLAVGYGSISFRYLLPAILPISLFLSYGLLEFKRLRGQLVAGAAIAMAGVSLLSIKVNFSPISRPGKWAQAIHKIYVSTTHNGVPSYLTTLFVILFIAGSVLLCWSLFMLSGKNRAAR